MSGTKVMKMRHLG